MILPLHLQLKCVTCANQALIDHLNEQYQDHQFRLISVKNDNYIYVTIRKMTNTRNVQDSFLTKMEASELLETVEAESVEVTDDIKVEIPEEDSDVFMPIAIVFIVLFCLVLAANAAVFVYWKYLR